MLTDFFERSVRVKPWTGYSSRKARSKQSVAVIPQSSFLVSARAGSLFNLSIAESVQSVDFATLISEGIVEEGWHRLSFEALAKKIIIDYDLLPKDEKESMQELEVFLLQKQCCDGKKKEERVKAPAFV